MYLQLRLICSDLNPHVCIHFAIWNPTVSSKSTYSHFSCETHLPKVLPFECHLYQGKTSFIIYPVATTRKVVALVGLVLVGCSPLPWILNPSPCTVYFTFQMTFQIFHFFSIINDVSLHSNTNVCTLGIHDNHLNDFSISMFASYLPYGNQNASNYHFTASIFPSHENPAVASIVF